MSNVNHRIHRTYGITSSANDSDVTPVDEGTEGEDVIGRG